jgi:arylsulfatase
VSIAILALLVAALACGAPERPPPRHLMLVTVDTLRADRLGIYGNPLGLTPHLDALAQEGIVFRHAFAPAPFTLASLSAILTGHYPDALGVRSNRAVVPASVVTLAEHLRAFGFRTPHTTADALVLLDELLESGERVFLWVHYQDPHGPYTAPSDYDAPPGLPPAGVRDRQLSVFPPRMVGLGGMPDYQQLGDERDSAFYRAAYHAEIRFLDEQLGVLFEAVRARGLWEETALAVTADHGEGLGEGGHWYAHGELVAPAETAIPLLLRVPGRSATVRDDLASLLDLVPTLLAVVGAPLAEPASAEAPGRDLLAPRAERRESVLFQSNQQEGLNLRRAILRDGHQYVLIRRRKGGARAKFRRLDGSPASDGEVLLRLRRELLETEAEFAKGPPEVRQDLSEHERARLEALGYIYDEEP